MRTSFFLISVYIILRERSSSEERKTSEETTTSSTFDDLKNKNISRRIKNIFLSSEETKLNNRFQE